MRILKDCLDWGQFMNKLGIIVAENDEYDAIIKIIKNIEIKNIYGLEFTKGKVNNFDIVVVKSGVGKVNAGRVTQILIDHFKVDFILNIGSAGSLNDELDIGDVIVAEKVVQHDFDVTVFGRDRGAIPDVGKYFFSDKAIFNKLINLKDFDFKLRSGIIASGDQFIIDIKMKNKIISEFNADCVEMEGGAVAQVCYMAKIPFCIIRFIPDKPNGNNHIDFNEFLKLASANCAKIIYELTKNI